MKPGVTTAQRPCVLVFAGHDPSGGAGIQADIEAIAAQGAHALTVVTSLTVQDNNQVYAVHPVAPDIVLAQAQNLIKHFAVNVVKLGIAGSVQNALVIASLIAQLRSNNPDLSVVLDPVLSSGHGHKLALDDAVLALAPLLEVATLITPNLPEVVRLAAHGHTAAQQAISLLGGSCRDVLLKGGHGQDQQVCNRWFSQRAELSEFAWHWPRLTSEFHGSGCTLAAAIAGQLACGNSMEKSLHAAQIYTQLSLQQAYLIAVGQLIPQRHFVTSGRHSFESDERETIR
nr:hydroxymethylpyrimidine/phosphomethylpyrimidine kinase [uncultured Undibacterium sp.]